MAAQQLRSQHAAWSYEEADEGVRSCDDQDGQQVIEENDKECKLALLLTSIHPTSCRDKPCIFLKHSNSCRDTTFRSMVDLRSRPSADP